jgi:hypothetical protein
MIVNKCLWAIKIVFFGLKYYKIRHFLFKLKSMKLILTSNFILNTGRLRINHQKNSGSFIRGTICKSFFLNFFRHQKLTFNTGIYHIDKKN